MQRLIEIVEGIAAIIYDLARAVPYRIVKGKWPDWIDFS